VTDEAKVTIRLDGREVEARPGELLIEAAERAGTFVPRFCYHPRMEPVGVCRMCLVEVDGPRGATLQPACYLRVADGMAVTTDSEKVKKAQDGVLEFLLANHPLDCPVCDKGGECPLQDQTLAHGSGETRFVEEKRHFVKPVAIGPLVLLDRERCIQCSRCTRFQAEVAGEAQIDFAGRGDMIEVAPSPEQPFDSVFSGNTVQICPVGALTAVPYRFSARPWDLEQVESTCTACAVGCRVAVQSSGNRLTRVLGLDAAPVNQGWLCDKGRFTLDAVDAHLDSLDPLDPRTRITKPLVRRDGRLVETTWGEALDRAATVLREAGGSLGAIGGAQLTNEGAFAWERLLRGGLGTENLDAQYGDGLSPALLQALPGATIDEAASARVLLTLTGDLREELPVLYLRLRRNLARGAAALVELSSGPSRLRDLARVSLPTRPGEAHLVADSLATGALHRDLAVSAESLAEARELLGAGEGVVIVLGRPNLAEDASVVEAAARRLAEALPKATFLPALRRANVRGALDAGLFPGGLAGRGYSGAAGRDAIAQLGALAAGEQRAVVLLGGDLTGNVVDGSLAQRALEAARVVCVTGHGGPDLAFAEVVLAVTVAHERTGTVTNVEGRVSAVNPKLAAPGAAWSDVAIAGELARSLGIEPEFDAELDAASALEAMTGYPARRVLDGRDEGEVVGRGVAGAARRPLDPIAFPGVRSTDEVGPAPRAGAVARPSSAPAAAPAGATLATLAAPEVAALPPADNYAWRLVVTRRLYDHGVAVAGSDALAALVEGARLGLHPLDLDRFGHEPGDEVRVIGERGEVVLALAADAAVPRGAAHLVYGARDGSGADPRASLVGAGALSLVRLESR
jgi:NADH-quinone oxidoreductase subunit G